MDDHGLVTCQICHAKYDKDYGRCWKCGSVANENKASENETGEGKQLPVHKIYASPKTTKQDSSTNTVLSLAMVFVLVGLCATAPGLLIPLGIGLVVVYVTSKNKYKDQPASKSAIDILVKLFAAMFLLPICVSVGLFILCGGFGLIVSIPEFGQGNAHAQGLIIALAIALVIACFLFWGLGVLLLKVLRG